MSHIRLADATAPELDERQQSVVATLNDWLRKARAGELRSVAIVGLSADGAAIPTSWSLESGDLPGIIGHLAILQSDLMNRARS